MRNLTARMAERLQCLRCGAHVVVREPGKQKARCEVCGSDRLEPVPEREPGGGSPMDPSRN